MPLTDDEKRQLKDMEKDVADIDRALSLGLPGEFLRPMVESLNKKVKAAEVWLNNAADELISQSVYNLETGEHTFEVRSGSISLAEAKILEVAVAVINKNIEFQNIFNPPKPDEQIVERSKDIEALKAGRDVLIDEQNKNPKPVITGTAVPTKFEMQQERVQSLERRMLVDITRLNKDIAASNNSELFPYANVNLQNELESNVLNTLRSQKTRLDAMESEIQDLNNLGDLVGARALEINFSVELRTFNDAVAEVKDVLESMKTRQFGSVSDVQKQEQATDILTYYQSSVERSQNIDATRFADLTTDIDAKDFTELNHNAQNLYARVEMLNSMLREAKPGEDTTEIYKTLDDRFQDIQKLLQNNGAEKLIAAMSRHPTNNNLRAMADDLQRQHATWNDFATKTHEYASALRAQEAFAATQVASVASTSIPEESSLSTSKAEVLAASNLVSKPASALPRHMNPQRSEKRSSLAMAKETVLNFFSSQPTEKDVKSKCTDLEKLKEKIDTDLQKMSTLKVESRDYNDARKKLLTHVTQYEQEYKNLSTIQKALTESRVKLTDTTQRSVDAVQSFHEKNIADGQLRSTHGLGEQPGSRGATPTRDQSPMSRSGTPTNKSPMSISPDTSRSATPTPPLTRSGGP